MAERTRCIPSLKHPQFLLYLLITSVLLSGSALGQTSDGRDPVFVLAVSRSIERILIILFSGLSLFLGFRLFAITTSMQGQVELQHQKTLVKLQNLGQGTFFALFGAAVMAFSLSKSFDFSIPTPIGPIIASSAIPIPSLKEQDIAQSLTTLQLYFQAAPNTPDRDDGRAQRAVDILASLREQVVDQRFGPGAYKIYVRLLTLKANPSVFEQELASQHQGELFGKVENFLTRPLGDTP